MFDTWLTYADIGQLGGPSGSDVAVMVAFALVAGLARGFSGFGAALIFMPVASALVGPKSAAAILWFIDTTMSLPMLPGAWRLSDKKQVGFMLAGAVIGLPLGTAVLTYSDPLALRWAIVVLVIGLLGLLVSGWRYGGAPKPPLTAGVGALSGIFAGAAQVGGPPVIAYWLGGYLPANLVRANIIIYFGLSSVLSGVNYGLAGILTVKTAALALAAAPAYAIGLKAGSAGFRLAEETLFRRICYGLIATAVIIGLPILDPVLR
ncbi:sulfite exporter TauE/SafE family protein [Rhizobium halophytocola]|uniref:Probable membrane transporter protein n=1 Tax=Rhizobium halophytocola TaxID=735519 RepID=A0ABS4DX97_9HYPH|nr:sulfite exporter TauE/SafE family protein [Rhizobium halophytocola]MBP1850321.1 putative membrane protein YfcA [Rhizobium halophytocola]